MDINRASAQESVTLAGGCSVAAVNNSIRIYSTLPQLVPRISPSPSANIFYINNKAETTVKPEDACKDKWLRNLLLTLKAKASMVHSARG